MPHELPKPGLVELEVLDGLHASIDAIAFSADDRVIATSAGGRVCVWDLATKRVVQQFRGRAACLEFSPDRTLLAGGCGFGDAVLWDLALGRERARLPARLPNSDRWLSVRTGSI